MLAALRRRDPHGRRLLKGQCAAASGHPCAVSPSLIVSPCTWCPAIPPRPPSPRWRRWSCRARACASSGSASIPCAPGSITTLQEMGAKIAFENPREAGGEPVADLLVEGSELSGVTVPAERAPSMIDEYPILAVAAALRPGPTDGRPGRAQGQGERPPGGDGGRPGGLRDRGRGRRRQACCERPRRPAARRRHEKPIATQLDHRIAMSGLVMGLAAERPVTIDDDARRSQPPFPASNRVRHDGAVSAPQITAPRDL